MSAFEKVIGYDTIKNELEQICDMIHNRDVYEALGAKLPQGVLLYGDPGLGKTLMAKCFIEETGLEALVIRRNKGNDDFIGGITDTFRRAKENAPCIVF
ncbi:MAG: AAA family ATPase, partial [Clostridia bacterium]|nr:AAA family ATPase [Clostridia bacterium]